ncbi:hypothetical protein ACFOU2_19355 [Bacillus songklensis]|uniref:Uncharacterized protein n=1 Tax=Bacillus songklensis TaxID=1069116 RepID=A0ABV8B7Z3_9BACI
MNDLLGRTEVPEKKQYYDLLDEDLVGILEKLKEICVEQQEWLRKAREIVKREGRNKKSLLSDQFSTDFLKFLVGHIYPFLLFAFSYPKPACFLE